MRKYIVIILLVLMICGCKRREKEIEGIVCIMYGYSWIPVVDICVNCKNYQLRSYCTDCGIKMPPVTGRSKCVRTGERNYTSEKYCGSCGSPNKLVLIERKVK